MRAPYHRDLALLPNFIGEPVRLGRRGGDGRDGHEVGGEHLRHVEVVNVLDIDPDVVALRPHDRAQEHRAQPWDADLAVHVQVRGLGLDEHELLQGTLHGWAPWSAVGGAGVATVPRGFSEVNVTSPGVGPRYSAESPMDPLHLGFSP